MPPLRRASRWSPTRCRRRRARPTRVEGSAAGTRGTRAFRRPSGLVERDGAHTGRARVDREDDGHQSRSGCGDSSAVSGATASGASVSGAGGSPGNTSSITGSARPVTTPTRDRRRDPGALARSAGSTGRFPSSSSIGASAGPGAAQTAAGTGRRHREGELVEAVGEHAAPGPAREVADAEQQQPPVGDHGDVTPARCQPLEATAPSRPTPGTSTTISSSGSKRAIEWSRSRRSVASRDIAPPGRLGHAAG